MQLQTGVVYKMVIHALYKKRSVVLADTQDACLQALAATITQITVV